MGDIGRVLVVGGGQLPPRSRSGGVEVVLIERRPDFDVPGVGLGQPANALCVYDALGVLSDILKTGFTYDRMYMFDANREELIVDHKFCWATLRCRQLAPCLVCNCTRFCWAPLSAQVHRHAPG
jgi:hypothetical protein